MKIAYFDTVAGVSGDMTLGAFVSAGVNPGELQDMILQLGLQGVEIQTRHISRNGITAVKVDVVITGEHHEHRHYHDIIGTIDSSSLPGRVKSDAKKIFFELGKAEAKIHNTPLEKVHFHEVGAIDSIVDIVGAAFCVDRLGIERIYSSPVKLGSGGFVKTEHGMLPLPGPAALEILRGYPTVLTEIPYELTTPTGAAIIKALSAGVLTCEKIVVEETGYGAGTREIAEVPNILRIMVGRLVDRYEQDEIVNVETNIDDMNPEIYPFLLDQLMVQGAHDAYLVPILMKKGRPGMLLSILTARAQLDTILGIVFSQTSTLGVRIQPVERKKLRREEREIRTSLGIVRAKVIYREGEEQLIPEYEECKRLALLKKMPLISIYTALQQEFLQISAKSKNL